MDRDGGGHGENDVRDPVFVTKHLKLATIGALYSVSMVLLLTAIGVLVFREPIGHRELLGILMAVGSLVLLTRFA